LEQAVMVELIPSEYMEMESLSLSICREVLTLMSGYKDGSRRTVSDDMLREMRVDLWDNLLDLHERKQITNPDGSTTVMSQLKLL